MNTRYFFAPDSLCTSVSITSILPAAEERQLFPRPSRNSPSFLIRLAMRVSRSRWYSYLRRVFHYQNGSGSSDLGPNPFDSRNWMLMELVALSVQIIATSYTLFVSKGEKPVWPMRIWVSGYAFGCFLSLVLLFLRYRLVYRNQSDHTIGYDIEHQRNHQESRNMQYMYKLKTSLELIFAIWFVMGNVWVFDSRFDSYHRAPKLHILCISLLAWNSVSYSFPFLLFVLLCCCVPLLSSVLGYNMNNGSHQRGATQEQLAGLSSWKYEVVGNNLELGSYAAKDKEVPECCICLAKYREKEEIRELPCTHIFHLNCVDQWLKIISCCPLCKQGIDK